MSREGEPGGGGEAGIRPSLGARRGAPRPGAVAAAERFVAAGGTRAAIGIVLGTGMGSLAERLTAARSWPGTDTGWLERSTATGHAGRVVCGTLWGTPLVMLQGRVHGYEGFGPETLSRGVEFLAALGVKTLLVTNASGGLRPDMHSGEIVVVTDHLDLVRRHWEAAVAAPGATGERAGPLYDPCLADLAIEATRRVGAVARRGVYAFLSGPSYETRAEYRMLRRFGADVVGMSTVPEVVVARCLGLEVVVCSAVTNVARPDAPEHTDAEEVCRLAADAAEGVWGVVGGLVWRATSGPGCGTGCG